jgi:serine/threonine-protein kinase
MIRIRTHVLVVSAVLAMNTPACPVYAVPAPITPPDGRSSLSFRDSIRVHVIAFLGDIAELNGDYARAVQYYSRALTIVSDAEILYFGRGVSHYLNRDYGGALADVTRAIEMDSKNEILYYNRGVAYLASHDYLKAISDVTQALALNPKLAGAYMIRAEAKKKSDDPGGSIADYTQAIKMYPQNTDAYLHRGNVRIDQQDYIGAIEDFSQILKITPKSAVAYNDLAWAEFLGGHQADALTDATTAIQLNPFARGQRRRFR